MWLYDLFFGKRDSVTRDIKRGTPEERRRAANFGTFHPSGTPTEKRRAEKALLGRKKRIRGRRR